MSQFQWPRAPDAQRVAIVIDLEHAYKWHQELFAGVYDHARKRGWQVEPMAFSQEVVARSATAQRPYDGIIGRVDRRLSTFARAKGIPLVNVWHSSPVREVTRVVPDCVRVGTIAAEHLLSRGFRRFAFVGLRGVRASQEQESGFREVIRSHGLPYETFWTPMFMDRGWENHARRTRALVAWLNRVARPIGVFTAQDILARHLINVTAAAGVGVPAEMGIVGAYNEEVVCMSCEPTVTSIDLGCYRIGTAAARMLEHMMAGGPAPTEPVRIKPIGLVARASTDVFASDDPLVARALRYISDNCHRPINVADVARAVKTCGRTLVRHFKRDRGCRVIDELTRMRVTRGTRLLAEGNDPIRTVARECGFAGRNSFVVAFRRVTGITPTEFRRQR